MQTLYFIRARDLVKIGITENLDRRLAQLQTGNPNQLVLSARIDDVTPSAERIYHRALKRWRVRGEWFAFTPLRQLVENIHFGARPLDEASIAHYIGLRKLKKERTPPPEGFGRVVAEVRSVLKGGGDWRAMATNGGLYIRAVEVIDRRLRRK